jgi:hypothetical protein
MRGRISWWALAAVCSIAAGCSSSVGSARDDTPRDRDAEAGGRRLSAVVSEHPFEVEGTVKSVGDGVLGMGRMLTVARRDAPTADLRVHEETRITLDDRPARLADLREGDEVRVVFDFDGGTAVAIEIEAEPGRR